MPGGNNPGKQRWEYLIEWVREYGFRLGIEIGVKSGKVTCELLRACPDLRMIAIDPWKWIGGFDLYRPERWDHERWYKNFLRNVAPYRERCEIWKMSSMKALRLHPTVAPDFVFIDGDHSFGGVAADILGWRPKIRHGGILAGHDYDLASVKRAVDMYVLNANITETDYVWWVRC